MAVQLLRRKFTADQYERMAESGILLEDDRVELLDGEIVEMTPIGSRHAGCVNRLNGLFSSTFQSRAIVTVQNPIRLDDLSEPQPDVALLKPRSDFYARAHPRPEDVLLVIEVIETSADYDRKVKLPLYAKAGIQEVWLVELSQGVVEAHRTPMKGRFSEVSRVRKGQKLSPSAFPDVSIAADDILG